MQWPGQKRFAFTIFDDCDDQTLDNVRDVYAFLADLGLRTTKSVWVIGQDPERRVRGSGQTCEDPAYLRWVLSLQEQGFEIALHNVSFETSTRQQTARGLERFRELFGHYPHTAANHSGCQEGIYWGDYRLTGVHKTLYNILLRNRYKGVHRGHIESSPLFWGDLCRDKIKYVRNFVFGQINTLGACPYMPYHDRLRPYVNQWFASAEGPEVESFVATTRPANQDRLAEEGGACIMYTHLANGFLQEKGRLEPRFRSQMERLAALNGWFVPVHTLLDYLAQRNGPHELTVWERTRLQNRWFLHKFRTGGTT